MHQKQFFPISLFCAKCDWNFVMSKGIAPFLESPFVKNRNIPYFLCFNYTRGDNIRLSFLTDKDSHDDLAVYADSYFNNIFSKIGLPEGEKNGSENVDAIFMPFTKNTIHYGLYKPPWDNEPFLIPTHLIVSETIKEAFGNEENIDDDTIITFAFCLTLAFIEVTKYCPAIPKDELLNFYNNWGNKSNNRLNVEAALKYDQNEGQLFNMANLLKNDQDNFPWLIKWMIFFQMEISAGKIGFNIRSIEGHSRVIAVLYEHLGLNEYERRLLFHFISKVLSTSALSIL